MKKEISQQEKLKNFDNILRGWQITCVLACLVLVVYLFFIQIVDLKGYRQRAKKQRTAKVSVLRGTILDRNGLKLASDKTTYDLYAHTDYYNKDSVNKIAHKLSPIIGMSEYELKKKLSKKERIIVLKKNLPVEMVRRIKKLELREISCGPKNERTYPQGAMAAQVLGYYNPDAQISAGIEYTAKKYLEYIEKEISFEKTPDGDVIYDFLTDPEATTTPAVGQTLTLTIDTAIQHICEVELNKTIVQKKALRGTVIVMNPKNGEILGYAVYPTYNPNDYKKAKILNTKNWTLTDVFPPGSTFKILTLASAMETGRINENTKVLDTGKIKVGDWEIKNYDYSTKPHPGMIDLEYLLEHSSNVGSIKVAQSMTSEEYYNMLKKFGFGAKTNIDLPGESRGLLPHYTQWEASKHASMGYGYAASVTTMQMVSAIAAIANDGVRITPHVIMYTPEEALEKIKTTQVMQPYNAKKITRLLAKSIGHSKSLANLEHYNVAAKTGTSLKPKENGLGYSNDMYTSIIGYFPAENPQVLIYVVIDSPKGGAIWGSTVAGPVFKEVANQVANILNIVPDKKPVEKPKTKS